MNDPLSRAALAVSAAEEGGIFDRLAAELADILGVAIGFVAVFADPSRSHMRMLSFRLDGRMRAPFSYPLEGSPCATVVGREFRCVQSGAAASFRKATCSPSSGWRATPPTRSTIPTARPSA